MTHKIKMKQNKKATVPVKTQSRKQQKRNAFSLGKKNISNKLLISVGCLLFALITTVIFSSQRQLLQGNAFEIYPTFVPLAPCTYNANCPKSSPTPPGGQYITFGAGTTVSPSYPAPGKTGTSPCTSAKAVGQTSAMADAGSSGNIIQLIKQFFQLLLQLILQLFGGGSGGGQGGGTLQPSGMPYSGSGAQPSGTPYSGSGAQPSGSPTYGQVPCPTTSAAQPSGTQYQPSGTQNQPSIGTTPAISQPVYLSPTSGSSPAKAGAISNLEVTGYNHTGVSFAWNAATGVTQGYAWKLTSVDGQGITISGNTNATHVSVNGLTKAGVYNFGIQGLPGGPGNNIHTPSMKG